MKYRVNGGKLFKQIEKEGQIFQSESFGVAYLPGVNPDYSCFGAVVSKKVSLHSVQRNRIKRAIFEALRQNWPEIKGGFNIIFLVKQAASRKPTDILMRETMDALRKADLTK